MALIMAYLSTTSIDKIHFRTCLSYLLVSPVVNFLSCHSSALKPNAADFAISSEFPVTLELVYPTF